MSSGSPRTSTLYSRLFSSFARTGANRGSLEQAETAFWTISQATLFVVGPVVPIQPRSWPWACRETNAPAALLVISPGRPSGSVSSCFPVRT